MNLIQSLPCKCKRPNSRCYCCCGLSVEGCPLVRAGWPIVVSQSAPTLQMRTLRLRERLVTWCPLRPDLSGGQHSLPQAASDCTEIQEEPRRLSGLPTDTHQEK